MPSSALPIASATTAQAGPAVSMSSSQKPASAVIVPCNAASSPKARP